MATLGAAAVFAAGIGVGTMIDGVSTTSSPGQDPTTAPSGDGSTTLPDDLALTGALTAFDACDDYLAHVQERALEQVGPYGLDGGLGRGRAVDGAVSDEAMAATDDAAGAESEASAPSAETTPDGVSGTNVQEKGVDEPDRVKTDGDTLYVATGDRLRIVDVTGDDPEELAQVPLRDGYGAELLLDGDRLLVTSAGGGFVPFAGEAVSSSSLPAGGGFTTTITAIDVTDPADPVVDERLTLDGATLSARMVTSGAGGTEDGDSGGAEDGDGVARVVIRTQPGTNLPWSQPEANGLRAEREAIAENEAVIRDSDAADWLPYYVHETADGDRDEGTLVACERVAQPEEFAGLGILSVLTVDVSAGALVPDAGTIGVLAGGDTIYASTDRLYVATQRWRADGPGGVPAPAPGGGTTAGPIDDITPEPRFPDDDAPEGDDEDREPDVTTELHAFDLADPRATTYLGSGEVDGTLLSQWALSEHDDVLRVASTVGSPWEARSSESYVTTLELQDGELVELGRGGELGPTETIHAVRFIGDVGYVVTFRQTDPLYTIDLTEPAEPQVTGELKILGYSGYLHPVGDGQLLGVGQDATEEGVTVGTQVSLFDVSDPTDPQVTDQVTVADSHSPVEHDHRSFLHWPATGLDVVPVTRWYGGPEDDDPPTGPASGALALTVDGDQLVAAADHDVDELALSHADEVGPDASDEEVQRTFQAAHGAAIQRSVVIDDRLLTVSDRGVVVHDLATLEDRGALGF
jgi:hypothetical protein